MVEIAKCRLCGSEAKRDSFYWRCSNDYCAIHGPSDDHVGTKWNALMSPAPESEPAAGTVRVRIGYFYETSEGPDDSVLEEQITPGMTPDLGVVADIPRQHPTEIPGTVESGE